VGGKRQGGSLELHLFKMKIISSKLTLTVNVPLTGLVLTDILEKSANLN
jgi:hypothetical protein